MPMAGAGPAKMKSPPPRRTLVRPPTPRVKQQKSRSKVGKGSCDDSTEPNINQLRMQGIVEAGEGVPPPPPHVKLIRDRAKDVASYLDEESLCNAACSCRFLNDAVGALRESRARSGPTTFATPPRRNDDTSKKDTVSSLAGKGERDTKYDEFLEYISSGSKGSDNEVKNTGGVSTSPRSVAVGLADKTTVDDINQPSFSSAPDVPEDENGKEDELIGGGEHSLLLAMDALDKDIGANNARPAKDEPRPDDEGVESHADTSDSIAISRKLELLSVEDQSDQLVLAFNSKRLAAGTPISFLTAPSVSENCRHTEEEAGNANSSELDDVDGESNAIVQEEIATLSVSLSATTANTECDELSPARFFNNEGEILTMGRIQSNTSRSSDMYQTISLGTSIDLDAMEHDATMTPLTTETSFESCQSGSRFDESPYDDPGEIPMMKASSSRQNRRNVLPVVDETAVPHLPPALDVPTLDAESRKSRFSRDYLVAEHDDEIDIMGQFSDAALFGDTPQLLTDFMSDLMVSAKHAANLVFSDGGRGSRTYLPANDIDDDGPIKIGEKFYSHNEALQLWRKAKIKLEDQYRQIDEEGNDKYKKATFFEKNSIFNEEVEEEDEELSEEELMRKRTLWREARKRLVQHDIDDKGNRRVERATFFERNSVFKEEPSCEGYEFRCDVRQAPEEDGEAVSLSDLIHAYTLFEAKKRSADSAMSADKTAIAQNVHVVRDATDVREASEERVAEQPTNDDAKPFDDDVDNIKTGPNSVRSYFESQASDSHVDTTTDEESMSTSETSQDNGSNLVNVNGCNFSAAHTGEQHRQISNSSELTPTTDNIQNVENDSEATSVANDSVLGSTYGLEVTASSVGTGMKAKFISGGEAHSVGSFGVKGKREVDTAMVSPSLQQPKLSSARKPRKLANHNLHVAKSTANKSGQPSRLHKLSASSLKLQKKAGSTLPKLFQKPGMV